MEQNFTAMICNVCARARVLTGGLLPRFGNSQCSSAVSFYRVSISTHGVCFRCWCGLHAILKAWNRTTVLCLGTPGVWCPCCAVTPFQSFCSVIKPGVNQHCATCQRVSIGVVSMPYLEHGIVLDSVLESLGVRVMFLCCLTLAPS